MTFDLDLYRSALRARPSPLAMLQPKGGYRPIPASIDPLIVEDSTWAAIAQASRIALKGMKALVARLRQPEHFARSQKIYAELNPMEQAAAFASDPSPLATARFDLFFDAGGLKIIEANATIPAMQAYSDIVRSAWLAASGFPDSSSPNCEELLASLLYLHHHARHGFPESRGAITAPPSLKPRIAIVARSGDAQTAELLHLQTLWRKKGHHVDVLVPDQLEIVGKKLRRKGEVPSEAYDLVYRHIFASRLDPSSDFAKALVQNQVFQIFNPIAAHLEIKAIFAELSRFADDEALSASLGLTPTEQGILKAHVPWTRILEKSTLDQAHEAWQARNARDYVVKSSSGYGGHAVYMGSHFQEPSHQERIKNLLQTTQPVSWNDFLDSCAADPKGLWIIQRRMEGLRMKHRILYDNVVEQESYVDASIFVSAHSMPRGGASRFAVDPIVNLGQGGGLIPMFLRSEYLSLMKISQKQ